MRGLALEGEFHADHAIVASRAPAGVQITADMGEDAGIHILEQAGAHIIGLGGQQLFRHARPQHDLALDAVLFHHILQRQRRHDLQWHAGIMAFAMPWRAFQHGLDLRAAGILRQAQQAIDVAAQRNLGPAAAPGGGPCGRNAGHAALHLEAILFQNAGQIFRRAHFLKAGFGIAEHLVHHDLRQLGTGFDAGSQILLQRRRVGCQCGCRCAQQQCRDNCLLHHHSPLNIQSGCPCDTPGPAHHRLCGLSSDKPGCCCRWGHCPPAPDRCSADCGWTGTIPPLSWPR